MGLSALLGYLLVTCKMRSSQSGSFKADETNLHISFKVKAGIVEQVSGLIDEEYIFFFFRTGEGGQKKDSRKKKAFVGNRAGTTHIGSLKRYSGKTPDTTAGGRIQTYDLAVCGTTLPAASKWAF